MHARELQSRPAPDRTHTALRVAAVVVLAAVCLWPRSRPAPQTTHAVRVDTAAEVTGAKRAPSPPRHVKLASATADETITSH